MCTYETIKTTIRLKIFFKKYQIPPCGTRYKRLIAACPVNKRAGVTKSLFHYFLSLLCLTFSFEYTKCNDKNMHCPCFAYVESLNVVFCFLRYPFCFILFCLKGKPHTAMLLIWWMEEGFFCSICSSSVVPFSHLF